MKENSKRDMSITFDWSFLDAKVLGSQHGITQEELAQYRKKAEILWEKVLEDYKRGDLAFWSILESDEAIKEIEEVRNHFKDIPFEEIVLLGIGGSALGMTTIFKTLAHPFHNKREKPRLFIMDNIDPATFKGLLDILNLERTLVIVISKSGTTAETMSQFLILKNRLESLLGKHKLKEHLCVITDPEKGILRNIARTRDLPSCTVPPRLGGRFSVLSPVGLLPSALLGIDVGALLEGASFMAETCKKAGVENTVVQNSLYHLILDLKKQKPIHVYWAYADGLYYFADWLRQLIAESLGKKREEDGVSVGVTPIKALGATDQHSQLQLYREGPRDKVITFLGIKEWSQDIDIPPVSEGEEDLAYLSGHTLGELLQAEQKATACALAEAGCPNLTLWFPTVNGFTIGQAFFFYELQTVFMGYFYGVNPFNQPGVELSKAMTYGLMGRKGFEEFRNRFEAMLRLR